MTAVQGAHRVRVLVCDDCVISRAGLDAVVHSAPDLVVVGHADTALSAADLARRLAPQVALVALDPAATARRTIRALRRGGVGVVVVSRGGTELGVLEAHRLGARSFLTDAVVPARLIEVIRAVARGETTFDPQSAAGLRPGVGQPAQVEPWAQARWNSPCRLALSDPPPDPATRSWARLLLRLVREVRITQRHASSMRRCWTVANSARFSRIQ